MADKIILDLLYKAINWKLRRRRDLKTHERLLLGGSGCLLVFLPGVISRGHLVEALRYIVLTVTRSSHSQMSSKSVFLKISQYL